MSYFVVFFIYLFSDFDLKTSFNMKFSNSSIFFIVCNCRQGYAFVKTRLISIPQSSSLSFSFLLAGTGGQAEASHHPLRTAGGGGESRQEPVWPSYARQDWCDQLPQGQVCHISFIWCIPSILCPFTCIHKILLVLILRFKWWMCEIV